MNEKKLIYIWVPCYVMDFKIFHPWNSLALERIWLRPSEARQAMWGKAAQESWRKAKNIKKHDVMDL